MVERERQRQHRTRNDLAILHDRLLLQATNREDRRLRIIDDRCATAAAEAAHIVEREGTAGDLGQREGTLLGTRDQVLKLLSNLRYRKLIGVAQDGNKQTFLLDGGDAHVVHPSFPTRRSSSSLAMSS